MKRLVNIVQLLIIAAIVYPVYYVWDIDRVEDFCQLVKPGMSQEKLTALAKERHLSLDEPVSADSMGVKWLISLRAKSSFSGFACEIEGAANTVALARIVGR